MDSAEKLERPALIERTAKRNLEILDMTGIRSMAAFFIYGLCLLQQLEWDQKHGGSSETLIALSRAYLHTGREDIWAWFEKIAQCAITFS
ncbi:MAG: hypothetical protein R2806_25260 [Saprospiraceae bacterium]